jgi:colanic acid biosynthesis glycosyl transferase WcaI
LRIRFFNTYEPVTSFYRDLLPFLSEHGFEVEVYVSASEYRPGRGPLGDSLLKHGVHVKYAPAGRFKLGRTPKKIWPMFTYAVWTAGRTLFGKPVNLNFFLSQPPLFSFWGYILKRIRRQRYYCLIMDVYPDLAIEAGFLKRDSSTARVLVALSRFILKGADSVVVIGRCMSERIKDMGICPEQIRLIPNWANEDRLLPIPRGRNTMRRELGLEDNFVILYSGNMGVSHYFDDLLQVAECCRETEGIRFVFAGDGERRKEIERAKAKHRLNNVLLLPFQPEDRLAEGLSVGDVHFISLRSGFEGLVVPSKAYGAMAVGRPIIYQGSTFGEIGRMVAETKAGTVVPLGDMKALKNTVLMYYENPSLVAKQGRRALEVSRDIFGRKQALAQYKSILADAGSRS